MKRITKLGLGAAAAAGIYYGATHPPEGCAAPEDSAEATDMDVPPEAIPPSEPVVKACDKAHSAAVQTAGALLVEVAPEHSATLSAGYDCASQDQTFNGEAVVAEVRIEDRERPERILYPTFYDNWRTVSQQAAALAALDVCAEEGKPCVFTGPGDHFYPGGEAGKEAERIFREANAKERGGGGSVETKVLDAKSVHTFNGRALYNLENGKTLKGVFNAGEILDGEYTVGGTVLKGRFSIGSGGEVIPKDKIALRFSDGGTLTCSFANGSPDGTQSATYKTPSGETVELSTFRDASSNPAWYGNFREFEKGTPGYYYFFDRYTVGDDFTLKIEENVKGPMVESE